jgi:hypothetical protein
LRIVEAPLRDIIWKNEPNKFINMNSDPTVKTFNIKTATYEEINRENSRLNHIEQLKRNKHYKLNMSTTAKPGDWKCPTCGALVYDWKNSCVGYRILHKSVEKKDAKFFVNNERILVPGTPVQKSGDWKCIHCIAINFARRDKCFKCSRLRENGPEIEKRADAEIEKRPGDWDCEDCGIMNFASRRECFKCKARRIKEDDDLCVV